MPSYAEHRLDIYDAQLYLATDKRQWQALRRRASFLDHVGHRPGAVDEPQAYLVGWLVRWMWHHCLPWITHHIETSHRQQARA